ncbi:bacterioferritin-associated ferredoxin [Allopseudospirillum japonicum]|uniref:Bacterioferritin-associated ferredoxin n=1 Tax=Allopseudospirillum japonicum TaxID=64971 RepID=A0A1H6TUJ3_9GAMM|nr:(2Fe-2S)-binding protein [Allopseudospirillum japonicum]SEI83723.1 bacterioferritin-associated ferredoxin [Allopseudospirillum japonicum]
MYVCICNAVTETDVQTAIDAGCREWEDLQEVLGVAQVCGCCQDSAQALLAASVSADVATEKMPTVYAQGAKAIAEFAVKIWPPVAA